MGQQGWTASEHLAACGTLSEGAVNQKARAPASPTGSPLFFLSSNQLPAWLHLGSTFSAFSCPPPFKNSFLIKSMICLFKHIIDFIKIVKIYFSSL